MKKSSLLIITLVSLAGTMWAQDKPVDSRITDVTVFTNKAQVTRTAKTRIDAGKGNLVLTGLPAQLEQQSIQVAGKGNFTILGISHQQNYLNELNMPRALKGLKDSLQYLQRQLALEQSHKEILNKEEQMLLSNQKIGGTNQNLTVAELRSMADFYRVRLGEIVASRMKQDEKITRINERIVKVQHQLNEQNELYSRNTSEIVVSVSAEAATAAEFEVSYVVPNAGWYPVYDLRASNTKSPVHLSYKANVYQSTGEEWKSVKLTLSTANPNQGGLKPELYAWYLDFERPVYKALQGRARGVAVAAPEMAVEEVKDAKAETAADYVNTVQTTLTTEFALSIPYTVTSSNKPTLVDIQHHELKADYQYSVTPKLDPDAFLMARITGWEEFSLLPGEANVFFEGTFVAKTYIDPNNIKDTLSLSLGRDKRIVVKREKLKDYTSRKAIGANQRDSYAYEVSVRNVKNETIRITVEDQVPVSQNSQIEVAVTDTSNAKYNKDTGKLTWELTLQPNETKKMVYKFDVKYPKDKIIPALF